jgi:hypothetical protein
MRKIFIVLFLYYFSFNLYAETISVSVKNTIINVHFNKEVSTLDKRYTYKTKAYIPKKYKSEFILILKKELSKYDTKQLLIFGPREIYVCDAIIDAKTSYAGMNLGDNEIAVKLSISPSFGEVIHHEIAHEILRKYNPHYSKNWTYTLLNELEKINSDTLNTVNKVFFQCHKDGYVSDYARTHLHEEFCEMFGLFFSGDMYATEFIINNPESKLSKKFYVFRSAIKNNLNLDIST